MKAVLTCLFFFISMSLFSQNEFFDKIDSREKTEIRKNIESSIVYPSSYTLLEINEENLANFLADIPKRSEKSNKSELPILELPIPNGTSLRFYIEEASIMHPKLQSKFPQIKSFAGYDLDNNGNYLRFDSSPKGFHFQILSNEYGTIKIDPVKSNNKIYQSYFKKDLVVVDDQYKFVCAFDNEIHSPSDYKPNSESRFLQGDNDLRDYKLAVACTGEYTNYHGGTTDDAIAAINTTMTRVVGIYERDFSITMTLIANNDDVIYTDGSTDPFTNGNASLMIDENKANMNAVIGSANFDVGHLFGTSGAGLAYLNGPCGSNKARATSAIANPMGDFFDVDYVCHEFGHQFGANHTQYNSQASCNRNPSTAMEPGSGSTIMAYAGICPPNIQNNSDDYFHAISIEEIKDFTTTGSGNNCPTVTDLGNTLPSVSAGLDYTIPKSTPFVLTADGSDPDGDILSFSWEQMDHTGSETQPPNPTNDLGPMFRSYDPSSDHQRYFPSLSTLVSGGTSTWEVLPSVERFLNFRVTVRDNVGGNGLTAEDDCEITVDDSSGPFVVTNPNTETQWNTGESRAITWNVANTNNAPVSCANVDIMLSTDGGYTYPTILSSNVSNDGSHTIVVPNLMSSFARIRVMCADNIFYDISDVNFGLNAPPFPEYCDVEYNNSSCSSGDFIDGVVFETISNTDTGCALDGANYSDYSNMKTTVENGMTYTLTVTANPNYAQYFGAYIDWNLDGDFTDANEFVDIGHLDEGTSESANITVPAGASMGEKLMRIICRYGTSPLLATDGCGTGFNYGEVEDYMIEVSDPCDFNLTVTQNYSNGESEILSASNNLTAANIINSGANITYTAGMDLDLNSGFEVKLGATFEAYIGPCQ